jgi:LemA protein
MKKTIYIVIALAVLVALYGGVTYNSLITKNEAITAQWAQVENQYQRRFDLIPNLVASVQGIMKQEQSVFTALADARARYSGAVTADAKAAAAGQVESSLGRLIAVVENYPDLKSSQAVQDLMVSLEGTENRVSVERKNYNDSVQSYVTSIQRFPTSVIALMFGFGPRTYFQVTNEAANTAPSVSL